jgi:hypothetical protein
MCQVAMSIKEKGKTECFALSHCQNIKTTTAYEKNLSFRLFTKGTSKFQIFLYNFSTFLRIQIDALSIFY